MDHSPDAGGDEDRELLRRYVEDHDRAALDQVLRRHLDTAFRVAKRITRVESNAEDVVQEAFIKVITHAKTYVPSSSVRAWILTIVTNEARNYRRDTTRRWRRERTEIATEPVAPSEPGDDRLEKIRGQLAALPEHERVPISLRFIDGLSLEEVASVLGLPMGTVQSQVHRGLDRLRGRLVRIGIAVAAPAVLLGLADAAEVAPAALRAAVPSFTAHAVAPAGVATVATGAGSVAKITSIAIMGLSAIAITAGIGSWALWPRTAPSIAAPVAVPALIVTAAPAAGTIRDSQGQPLAGSVLPVGGSLSGSGRWELSSPDQRVTLSVSGDSRLAMADPTTVRLDQGELTASVPSGGSAPWPFVTPHAEARINGARFTLTVTDGATELAVAAGIVSFQPTGGEAFPVAAGASSLAESPARRLWYAAPPYETHPDRSVGTARILSGPDQRSGFRGVVLNQEDTTSDVAVAFASADGRPLAELPPGSRLAADLWLDPGTSGPVTVQGWDLDPGLTYQIALSNLPRGSWFSLNVPIADFRPVFPERTNGPLRRPRVLMFVVAGDQTGAVWVARARLLTP